MFVELQPKWIQPLGFFLILLCGSGVINGFLSKLGIIEERLVSPLYRGDLTLPICSFFLGLGLGLYLVPRLIFAFSKKKGTK